jgi:toxin ParE1/3/4
VARLVTRGNAVDSFPLAGRAVPELGRSDIRETFLRTYRIIYRVEGTESEIAGISVSVFTTPGRASRIFLPVS